MSQANMWDLSKQMTTQALSSGGSFVRLRGDGDKVVGAFCGDPLPRELIWNGQRYEGYDKDVHVGKRPTVRVSLNFYVPAEDEMKVVDLNARSFDDVMKLRKKYGLENWLFEIERHGDSGDPKTKYSILPDEQIDDAMRAKIASARLHDLGEPGAKASGAKAGDEGPIDATNTAAIIGRLKALPRSCVNEFLDHFKVGRVRDLRVSDGKRAYALLAELEAQAQQPEPATDGEVDPFA